MSYGDRIPLREDLLTRLVPLLDELKGTHTVLGYDVQLKTVSIGQPPNLVTHDSWAIVLITSGALIGPSYNLSYVWNFGTAPHPPSDKDLRDAVRETFKRLGLMRMRQLQQQTPPNSN